MFILTMHWDLRALLAGLTITARFYVFALLASVVYSTFSSVRSVFSLYRVSRNRVIDVNDRRSLLLEMASRIQNLRQFHTLLFLLFGACCANEVIAILRAIQYSSASLSAAGMDIFEPVTAFAFFVFVVLLVLHIFQWAVAARLRAMASTSTKTVAERLLGAGINS
jgi:hypothetical protein